MRHHFQYLSYVLRHKWFVLLAGYKTGAPLWRLIIHDWSKFLPSEWFPYAFWFYGNPVEPDEEARMRRVTGHCPLNITRRYAMTRFSAAWNHHQKRNPHHWQYWLLVEDSPENYPRYNITSIDGGLYYHSLTESMKPFDPSPVSVGLEGLEPDGGAKSQAGYSMVSRCCKAANAPRPTPLPMPLHFIREMVADWAAAGRAIHGRWEVWEWYEKNRDKIQLHPDTREIVEGIMAESSE